nr:hypothetical protein [Clostridia bacterium]
MAFINLAVLDKNRGCRFAFFGKLQNFLLVFTGDLGIGNYERWYQGMSPATGTAFDTLDDE